MNTGVIKLNHKKIVFADSVAQDLLSCGNKITGKNIQSFFPAYQEIQEENSGRTLFLTYRGEKIIVTEARITEPSPITLMTIIRTHQLALRSDENQADYEDKRLLDSILRSLHDDIVISDRKGTVLYVSDAFLDIYGVKKEDIVGRSVYQIEKEKIFRPAATSIVLSKKKEVTFLQETKKGNKLVITAVPIFDENNEVEKVVSYSRDIPAFLDLKRRYESLEKQMKKLSTELDELRGQHVEFSELIYKSPQMRNLINLVNKVAHADINLLVTGESGVGKSLIARLVHQNGPRQKGPFIEINCGSIPENLLESELFGYEAGAFTGASKDGKIGMIELASEGTLFLDEIGELSLRLQVKLLKVIQEKTLSRLGGIKAIHVDFRLISATNQKIQDKVKSGQFRTDLFYRLNVVPIQLPPLRERKEDVVLLLRYYLKISNKRFNQNKKFTSLAVERLVDYSWPGNVRELKNLIERVVITSDKQKILDSDLPSHITSEAPNSFNEHGMTLAAAKERLECKMICDAYRKHKTTVAVAKALGISQPSATRKIKKYANSIHQ